MQEGRTRKPWNDAQKKCVPKDPHLSHLKRAFNLDSIITC